MKKSLWIMMIFCCGLSFSASAQIVPGDKPALTVQTLDGKNFDLAARKKNVVIVHFWATWCSSCKQEMPALEAFYLRHHSQGIEVIAVSLDSPHDREGVMAYMRPFHFPAGLISDAGANDFGNPRMLPVTYIIDAQGKVAKVMTPDIAAVTEQNLENAVLPLLAKP